MRKKVNPTTSMFIGETSRGVPQPVLFDTHSQIFNNRPPVTLITGSPGSGKDLDINTLIPTPFGFVKMKDLKVGDKVLDRSFRPCRVTYVGEIESRQTYKVILSDKREIIAGEEHQWSVSTLGTDARNDDSNKQFRAKFSALYAHNENYLRILQKNLSFFLGDKEWVTVQEMRTMLTRAGIFITGDDATIANTMRRYAVIVSKDKKIERGEMHITKKYNAYMGMQALLEDVIELKNNIFYGERIVTTKDLVKLLKTSSVSIRSVVPVDGSDRYTTGFLEENNVKAKTKELAPLLADLNDELSYGAVKHRRAELEYLIEKLSGEDVESAGLKELKGELFTVNSRSIKDIKRINFLAHSLGVNSFISDDSEKVSFEAGKIFNSDNNANNYTHVISVKKLDKRETRCISVDSADHVYLATEGFIPTHNTFLAMTLTCLSAVLGKTTVVLDPKGDFLSLAELKGDIGNVSFWALKDRKKAGILDPFYMAKTDGEKLSLVLEVLSLFLGGLDDEKMQVLSPIVKDTIESEVPSLLLLKENLEMNPNPKARAIGTQLDIISKLPFASLCFAPGISRQAEISIEEGVTVITMAGLELNPDSSAAKSSNKARLSSAVFFLITDFIRRIMHESSEDTIKTVIVDEAWAVLSTDEGARAIKELALLGRSKNVSTVLITQNTSHLDSIDSENTISSRFAFRTNEKEGIDIVHNMGLPEGEGFEKILTDLNPGECLMNDWQGRYSTVQISQYNKRWKEAFETNPMEKMKKRKEKEARERKLAQQKQNRI